MDNKFVALVGVMDKLGSTNIPMAASFMRLGYNVLPINYRTLITRFGMDYFEKLVVYVCKKNPYMILFAKCNNVNPDLIKECSKYTKTWLWNPDPIMTIQRCPEVIEHAKNAHFSSCTGKGTAEWFAEQGVKNCYHVFCGLDYKSFSPVESVEELKATVSFIGTRTEERETARAFFIQRGYDTKFYGQGYKREAVNEDFAKVCSSSKFVLSMNNEQQPLYFSNRLLRYMGCGACVLHYDPTETLGEIFEDGKEIILFPSFDVLEEKIKGLTDEQIGKIALAGREKALKFLTWDHTINYILSVVGEEKAN